MMFANVLAFLRVVAVFGIVFLAIPYLVCSANRQDNRVARMAAAFVRVSLLFAVAVVALGASRLNLPGTLAAAFCLWLAWTLYQSRRSAVLNAPEKLKQLALRVLGSIETGWKPDPRTWLRRWSAPSTAAVFLCLLAAGTLLQRGSYSLLNLRFANIDTYARTVALEQFVHGDTWQTDTSVSLLAPMVLFTGLQPHEVIRFSGPVFALMLVFATGFCAFRYSGNISVAYGAAALMAIAPVLTRVNHAGEIGRADLAVVYWTLAVAFAMSSWRVAVRAAATALLIHLSPDPAIFVPLACVLVAWVAVRFGAWLPTRLRPILTGLSAGAFATVLVLGTDSASGDGPYEYEAAARACFAIEKQFERNQWLIVSPVHELAFTYGRGWHTELVDFVSKFSVPQVSRPEFVLPYPVRHVFVFVEKHPLEGSATASSDLGRLDLTQSMDVSVLSYNTGLGRASAEFQAAALVSAYAPSHSNLRTFYEDEQLVVYQISQGDHRPGV